MLDRAEVQYQGKMLSAESLSFVQVVEELSTDAGV